MSPKSQYWPGFVDEEAGVGRDRDGTWFVALPVTQTVPGVWETVLKPGWFPGMKAGWRIMTVAMQPNGRPLYYVESAKGLFSKRCLRRQATKNITEDMAGWCFAGVGDDGVTCQNHRNGDGSPGSPDRRRSDYLYAGDEELDEGWQIVGFIPGTAGGDTYFVRTPQGSIRSACLRKHWDGEGRCLYPAGARTGRRMGACFRHGGASIGAGVNRLMNLMDPGYQSLLRTTVKSAQVDPAAQQLKTRIDLLRYGWYLFVGAVIERRQWLDGRYEKTPDLEPDRMVGIGVILAAANTIITGTAIQGDVQANQFKATAKTWASQAYCMRLARLLIEIAQDEGEEVARGVMEKVQFAMLKRGLIANASALAYGDEPAVPAKADVTEQWALEPIKAPAMHPQSAEELELLGAMSSETKQMAYTYISQQLGDTMLSLYPLMGVLQDLLIAEEHANAPFSVRQKILAMLQTAQKSQLRIEKALDIAFTAREEDIIGKDIGLSVSEALQGLPPVVQKRILGTFLERKDEIELPKKGHEQRMGEKILEVAG